MSSSAFNLTIKKRRKSWLGEADRRDVGSDSRPCFSSVDFFQCYLALYVYSEIYPSTSHVCWKHRCRGITYHCAAYLTSKRRGTWIFIWYLAKLSPIQYPTIQYLTGPCHEDIFHCRTCAIVMLENTFAEIHHLGWLKRKLKLHHSIRDESNKLRSHSVIEDFTDADIAFCNRSFHFNQFKNCRNCCRLREISKSTSTAWTCSGYGSKHWLYLTSSTKVFVPLDDVAHNISTFFYFHVI